METKVISKKITIGLDGRLYHQGHNDRLFADYTGKILSTGRYIVYFLKDGVLHCEDGPAVIHPRMTSYYYEGKKHRNDGWATKYENGAKEYYIHGKQLTLEQFLEQQKGTEWWPKIMAEVLGKR